MRKFERMPLRRGDGGIVDHVGLSKPLDPSLQAGRSQPGKFRYRLHVDVERIEKETAVREVRAWLRRPIIEQSMQRIEADAGGSEISGKVDERAQIGEVAVAPIAGRAHAVELHRQDPHPLRRGLATLISTMRTDDEGCILDQLTGWGRCRNTKAEGADGQLLRQHQQGRNIVPLGNQLIRKDLPPERQARCRRHPYAAIALGTQHDGPWQHSRGEFTFGRDGVEQSSKNIRFDGPQTPEPVPILRLYPPKSRAFEKSGP